MKLMDLIDRVFGRPAPPVVIPNRPNGQAVEDDVDAAIREADIVIAASDRWREQQRRFPLSDFVLRGAGGAEREPRFD